jgi:hypothetical protein
MALLSARNNRLLGEEVQETSGHLINGYSPVPGLNRPLPVRVQASGASCWLTPGR